MSSIRKRIPAHPLRDLEDQLVEIREIGEMVVTMKDAGMIDPAAETGEEGTKAKTTIQLLNAEEKGIGEGRTKRSVVSLLRKREVAKCH